MSELNEFTKQILEFRDARNWRQFHTVKNLATSISVEAAELLELFQWTEGDAAEAVAVTRKAEVSDELADVAIYTLLLAHHLDIDLADAIRGKIRTNEDRYPVDRARGNARKHTEL